MSRRKNRKPKMVDDKDMKQAQTELQVEEVQATVPVGMFASPAIYVNQISYLEQGSMVRLTCVETLPTGQAFERGAIIMPIEVANAMIQMMSQNIAAYAERIRAANEAAQQPAPPTSKPN